MVVSERLFITALFVMVQMVLRGQTLLSDSSVRNTALNTLVQLYDESLAGNSHLYNGPEYINKFKDKVLEGHPYYVSDDWQEGFIFYDGQFYKKTYLLLNLYQNKLIIEHPTIHREIELITEKISWFGIGDVVFDRVQSPMPGFYERIYKGDTKVYAYYFKEKQENNDSKRFIVKFLDYQKLYIVKDDVFYPVKSKSSALKVFQDRKSELKKFLNEKNIQYHLDRKFALGKMAEYVDYLNSGN